MSFEPRDVLDIRKMIIETIKQELVIVVQPTRRPFGVNDSMKLCHSIQLWIGDDLVSEDVAYVLQ